MNFESDEIRKKKAVQKKKLQKAEVSVERIQNRRGSMEEDLVGRLRTSIILGQIFGLASFDIVKEKDRFVLVESPKRKNISKICFCLFTVFHGALMVISFKEILAAREDLSVKFARIVNLLAFTGSIGTMFFTTISKGRILCVGLNQMNTLHAWFLSKAMVKKRRKFDLKLLLGTVFNYLITVFPLLLTALYVQKEMSSKVISYSYYAISMWMENIFVYQFVSIATIVGEAYSGITKFFVRSGMSDMELLRELRRSRLHDEIFKDFVDVLVSVYKYALLFWTVWSFTMILQFVLKVNLRLRVVVWCFFISYRMITVIFACDVIRNEVFNFKGH